MIKQTSKLKLITLIVMALGGFNSVYAQNIYTVAGNGTAGYNGDGLTATSAELNGPTGIAVDASGNIYVADYANNRIRKINTAGIISTVAGNGTAGFTGDGTMATGAEIDEPMEVAVDASNNIYIADYGNNRIRKINTAGIISTVAGNGTAGFTGDGTMATGAEIDEPMGVAVDASNNIYIADYWNNRVRKVNSSGIISTVAGDNTQGYNGDGGMATAAELYQPASVFADASGNIYISDITNNRVRKVNSAGIISTVAGNGTYGFTGDGGMATAAEINMWKFAAYKGGGVTLDASGNMYIADFDNFRIRKVNTSGIINTIAGNGTAGYNGDGIMAMAAELNLPTNVALDASGNLYIADYGNNRIRKIALNTTGIAILTDNNSVSLYPNPANTVINLSFTTKSTESNATINVLDVCGKLIFQTTATISNGKTLPINISSLSAGIYFVRITTEKNTQTIKFVKGNN